MSKRSWASLVEWGLDLDGVLGQPIWNYKFICIQTKSIYYPKLKNMGISKNEGYVNRGQDRKHVT